MGKSHRKPISKPTIPKQYNPLELLVADTIGAYPPSADGKTAALVVMDAGSSSVRIDNGTEFCNTQLDAFLGALGILHQVSIPY